MLAFVCIIFFFGGKDSPRCKTFNFISFYFILHHFVFLNEISDPINKQIYLHRWNQNVHAGKLHHSSSTSALQLCELLLQFIVPHHILLHDYRNMLNISKETISFSIFTWLLLDGIGGLFKPKWLYDSTISFSKFILVYYLENLRGGWYFPLLKHATVCIMAIPDGK